MLVVVSADQPKNLANYLHLLARLDNVQTKTFTSSSAALVWSENNDPDLIILDFRVPPPDSVVVFYKFRQSRPDAAETPIVVITSETDLRISALEAGASDFLTVPVHPVEFLTRVKNLLALREGRKRLQNQTTALQAEVARQTKEIADREQETIERLVRAAEFRDSDTGNHIVRMGRYAALLGRALGHDEEDQRLLLLATPLHDIGKVSTPDRILLKRGSLTDDEWAIMKNHAQAGYDILVGSQSKVLKLGAIIALRHHEKWDGSGYPGALRGTQIPLAARICAISDVFDALISVRPYKPAWPIRSAFAELRNRAGKHFDPILVEAFLDLHDEIETIATFLGDSAVATA